MQKNTMQKATGFLSRKRRRRAWKRVVRFLACIVVFCTVYALILPAITLETSVATAEASPIAESGSPAAEPRTLSPDVLDGKFFTLYNPASKSAVWNMGDQFMPIPTSSADLSFLQKSNGLYTAVAEDEMLRSQFISTYRQWTFVKSEDGSGCYIKIGSLGTAPQYLQMGEGQFQLSNDPSAIFTVREGTGAFAGQFMLISGDYAVGGCDPDTFSLNAIPLADAQADPNCYFYMVDRAMNPVDTAEGIAPSGTVINMFDYWITEPGAIDQSVQVDYEVGADHRDQLEGGINQGHVLKFLSEGRETYAEWNDGTQHHIGQGDVPANGASVYQGLVRKLLGGDGYPVLDPAKEDGRNNTIGSSESLAYLFDPVLNTPFRSVHRNVSGLLQIDTDGYHYYDSRKNYAYLCEPDGENSANEQITLYDKAAVDAGQFFPFSPYDVASEQTGGDVQDLSHYFGLTLTSKFYQLEGGKKGNTAITFEFSGDDDVWIFIDDVLVADLGGIHGRSDVNIDFSTGAVVIGTGDDTTIKAAFEAAGKDVTQFNGDTLPDRTYHTLNFFYLERGASQSNLSLKYNLVNFPTSGITKVDQVGDPVPGAEFTLYHANASYEASEQICSGITGDNGEFVFLDADSQPLTLQDLYTKYYTDPYFVLKETKVPQGYRGTGADIHLRIHTTLPAGTPPPTDATNVPYVMVCENTSQCGAWASSILQVVAPNEFTPVGKTEQVTFYNAETGETNGQLFGVVLKYVGGDGGDRTDTKNWMPVYGSAKEGYTIVDPKNYGNNFIAAVLEASSHYGGQNYFRVASSGRIEATIDELPGKIDTYNFLAGNDNSKYIVAYYYTDNSNQTSRVRDYTDTGVFNFTRNFGTAIQVPNMANRIAVQKLDEDGTTPLNGAVFAMYEVEDTDPAVIGGGSGYHADQAYFYVGKGTSGETAHLFLEADPNAVYAGKAKTCHDTDWTGTYIVEPRTGVVTVTLQGDASYTITPVALETTVGASDPGNHYLEDGIAEFDLISAGKYIIRELTAPAGYTVNANHAMVLVTQNAIYANAGTATDGIEVSRGPGYLAGNLHYFATWGDIDNTLSWVYSKLKVSPESSKFVDVSQEKYASWQPIKTKRDGTSTGNGNEDLVAYLVYAQSESDSTDPTTARFSYAADAGTKDPEGSANIAVSRRLYTKTGWSYLEIYQNYGYGINHHSAHADYDDWRYVPGQNGVLDDLSNLFSRSVYIHVSDQKQPADLEITKTVQLADTAPAETALPLDQTFTFTVTLTQDGTPVSGSYSYQIYNLAENGDRTADGNPKQLLLTDGSGTITLKHRQAAVIQGLPSDAQYTVTETLPGKKFTVRVTQRLWKDGGEGSETLNNNTVSGPMYWQIIGGELDKLSKVDFVNFYDPNGGTVDVTLRKVDGADSGKVLAGAEFTLTNADGKYYSGSGWVDTETKLTTDAAGEIHFAHLEDGTYTLTETKAPGGYYAPKGAIELKITNGVISAAADGSPLTIDPAVPAVLAVPNYAGHVLPATGGPGTALYTLGGLFLTAVSLLLLCGTRWLKRKEE